MDFPNYKKGISWGLAFGFTFTISWFAACYLLSKSPAASEVSISLALQPWWKFWGVGIVIFAVVTLVVGILTAVRPNLSKSKKLDFKN